MSGTTFSDMFCGAGGSTKGAVEAGAVPVMAMNHWPRAITSHATNYPKMKHDCADISQANPKRYPSTDILLASPECTNHSGAKGAARIKPQAASLWEDGPAGDAEQERSRCTMWDVVRFAEVHRYKAIVVENVVEAFKWGPNDDGSLFAAWLGCLVALGYQHEIVWLNSMFAGPVPQSRDRMYVVFWRKGMRRPNLRVEPESWCGECNGMVQGQQAWKRHDRRPWGRFGAQYVYACPHGHGQVTPAALPAATVIDWDLKAIRIGDRTKPLAANTIKRIQRGLDRLTADTGPRPLTMVLPVAGNTYESTPGNRARDACQRPMPTVHGTMEQALVYADRQNVVPRIASLEPSHGVCAGANHLGLVMANYTPGWMRPAEREPFGSITTTDGHGLVVPYYSTGEATAVARVPVPTLTTRDRVGLAWGADEINACRYRMFALHEIARTMALHQHADGSDYVVTGNKREQMAQYGNAVTPPVMKLLVSRLLEVL